MENSDAEHASGRAVFMSTSSKKFVDTSPKAANNHAKDVIAEYEAGKPNSELVGGEREDKTLWYASIAVDGTERCEVQVIFQGYYGNDGSMIS